jgi:hypothetical protein
MKDKGVTIFWIIHLLVGIILGALAGFVLLGILWRYRAHAHELSTVPCFFLILSTTVAGMGITGLYGNHLYCRTTLWTDRGFTHSRITEIVSKVFIGLGCFLSLIVFIYIGNN